MLLKKPPIIVILGHIDHGKTTLLDYIRRSNISSNEAGGITQRIGAYEIEYKGEKMTFIDTPGHAAFNTLRERGVKIADLAVLIIAADDGVKPQTQESLNYLKSINLPFVIALNKIDKKEADTSKVISQLIEANVLPEKFGGNVPLVEISALKGVGVDELLEILILLRDLNDLQFDNEKKGQGFILETFKDSKRGILASAIVTDGEVRYGDYLVTSNTFCKIKIFEDDRGNKIDKALPSKPFLVGNFDQLPLVGDFFSVCSVNEIEKIREEIKSRSNRNYLDIFTSINAIDGESLNLILRADTVGSLEALANLFRKIIEENNLKLKFVKVDVGPLTLEDIYLAKDLKAILINFNLKIDKSLKETIKSLKLTLLDSNIIYQLEKSFLEYLELQQQESSLNIGQLEILAIFSVSKNKKTVGGQVINGALRVGQKLFLKRNGETIGQLKILSIEKNKVAVNEIKEGDICGLMVESLDDIQVGDVLSSSS